MKPCEEKVWIKATWTFCFRKLISKRGPMRNISSKKRLSKILSSFFRAHEVYLLNPLEASWERSFLDHFAGHLAHIAINSLTTSDLPSNDPTSLKATGGRLDHLSLADWQCYRALGGTLQHVLQVRFFGGWVTRPFNKNVFPNDLTEVVELDIPWYS